MRRSSPTGSGWAWTASSRQSPEASAGSPGSDLRVCVAAVALHDVPSWPNDDARGRQSRPKRRNRVERGPTDLFHTLIWLAPAE